VVEFILYDDAGLRFLRDLNMQTKCGQRTDYTII